MTAVRGLFWGFGSACRPLNISTKASSWIPVRDPLEEILFGRRMQKRPPTVVGSLFAILAISVSSGFDLSIKKWRRDGNLRLHPIGNVPLHPIG